MKISVRNIFFGPNPYSSQPVIIGDLEIGEDIASHADSIISEIEKLTNRWFDDSGDVEARDNAERLAGFIMRWCFAALTYPPNFLTDFGCRTIAPNRFRIWIAFHDPQISLSALEIAANLTLASARGEADPAKLQDRLDRLWRSSREKHPDAQTQIAMQAARVRDIPTMPGWNLAQHWQFGWGAKSEVLFIGTSNRNGFVSGRVVAHKQSSKALIRRLGLPTPDDAMIGREDEIAAAVGKVGFPCVVKPVDLGGGNGISVGLNSAEQVLAAFRHARKFSSKPVMIEALAPGSDHRIMIMDGRVVGTFRRDPPSVVGDGNRTIRELVEEQNRGRMLPGVESISRLASITFDNSVIDYLARQGVSPDDVLPSGKKVTLRGNANLVTGGSCTNVSTDLHPEIRMAAEALVRTLDVDLAGFDYITTDISRPWWEVPGSFIELNQAPALDVLTLAGLEPAEVGKPVLGTQLGRIPLEVIIAPDDQVAAVEAFLTEITVDQASGWASHDHAGLGNLPLSVHGSHPWSGVLSLLSHRLLEKAIIVVASKHLQKSGLPVDRADRIWICDSDLPREWLDMVGRASLSVPSIGTWDECRKDFQAKMCQ